MEQELLEQTMKARASWSESYEQPRKRIESEKPLYYLYFKGKNKKVRETSQSWGSSMSEKEPMAPPKKQSVANSIQLGRTAIS